MKPANIKQVYTVEQYTAKYDICRNSNKDKKYLDFPLVTNELQIIINVILIWFCFQPTQFLYFLNGSKLIVVRKHVNSNPSGRINRSMQTLTTCGVSRILTYIISTQHHSRTQSPSYARLATRGSGEIQNRKHKNLLPVKHICINIATTTYV